MAKKPKNPEPVEGEEEEKKGGGKLKKLVMIGGVLGALFAVYSFVLKPTPEPMPDGIALVEPDPIEGEIIELPEMVINIEDDSVTFLRIGVAIVLEEGTLAADFEGESAIAEDIILNDLSGRSAEELRSPLGKQLVKDTLSNELRAAYGDEKVIRVLFTVLVMQ